MTTMQNDRKITISSAGSRRASSWPQQVLWWSDFIDKLRTPVRSTETLAAYLNLPKAQQDDLKDVGGFVGGAVQGKRTAANIAGRDLITLDLDNIPSGGTKNVLQRIDGLGCGYAVYSTRKHEEIKPRLRVIIPLDRTVSADEYEPIARKIAGILGIEYCDATTFQAARLMYWPSCCSDSRYVFRYGDKPMLSADGVLAMYGDWRNVAEWPQVPGADAVPLRLAKRQGDPTQKPGAVGAFCRIYDVYHAMSELIPEEYEPCDVKDRFTYTGGSTAGGAIAYEDGKFLYSHHATDPAGGKLCNAFDLVRLHRFGNLDEEAKPDTPTNKLPSYAAMMQFALADQKVLGILNAEQLAKAKGAFTGDASPAAENDAEWMLELERNGQGTIAKSMKNYRLILEHDPALAGRVKLNLFSGRPDAIEPLPWTRPTVSRLWADSDTAQLRLYMEPLCGKPSKADLLDALEACASNQAYHPVRDYLLELSWDGTPRLDTLFVDYLGVEDTPYARAVTRKSWAAGVARIMVPGIKYDTMPVLVGGQGRHKSSILAVMGGEWFSDSLRTFEGKEAMEAIQGTWINEIAELNALNRSDINAAKAFLSKQHDYYRAAYGRYTADRARQCVFFGTTNSRECLTDTSGGRRFWPLDIDRRERRKNVFRDLPAERDQIWAEAVMRWRAGEALYLPKELEEDARSEQELHRERHPWEGPIEEFLSRKIPENWMQTDLETRMVFWGGHLQYTGNLVERDRICAAEIWCEMLKKQKGDLQQRITREINQLLDHMPGWENVGPREAGGPYGKQRCFRRIAATDTGTD